MRHLGSSPRHAARARTAVLALMAVSALGGAVAGPADAKPIGPCDGPCPPKPPPASTPAPKPKPKLVTVYLNTYAYSTPYRNARHRYPLRPTTYIATCEAYSSSAGRFGNRWWTRLRSGVWVNNGDLNGGVKMNIGNCRAPRNDAVTKPKPAPVCVRGKYQKKYLGYIRKFRGSHSIMRLTWQPDLCKDRLGLYGASAPTLEPIGIGNAGLGLNLRAPERTSGGVTYRGDIRQCVLGTYKGIGFGGLECVTIGRARITATPTSRGVSVGYQANALAISKVDSLKWVWTNKPLRLF